MVCPTAKVGMVPAGQTYPDRGLERDGKVEVPSACNGRRGYWVNIFNDIQNMRGMIQVRLKCHPPRREFLPKKSLFQGACNPIMQYVKGGSLPLFWIRDVFCTQHLLVWGCKAHLKSRFGAPF